MSLALAFWIVLGIAVLFGAAPVWNSSGKDWRGAVPSLVVLFLIFLLGWAVFGAPLHG